MNEDLFVPGSIRYVKRGVLVCCNSGEKIIHYKGRVGLGEAWFDVDGIANIYSFAKIRKLFPTRYMQEANVFEVDAPGGLLTFGMSSNGLYYLDVPEVPAHVICATIDADSDVIPTVAGAEKFFTKRQVKDALRCRRTLAMVGRPSTKDYKAMVRGAKLKNCPVVVEDIANAHALHGTDIGCLVGKTVRRRPDPVLSD